MTQGQGGQVPLPYLLQPTQPNVVPRDSSTFVYNGRPLSSDPTPRHIMVDNDEYKEEQLTDTMLGTINAIEQQDLYKAQLETMHSVLSMTEEALSESLVCEADLRSELDNARAILSTRIDGTDSNINISHCQVGSAARHPSTPRISHHTSPTPRIVHHTPPISHISSPTYHDCFDRLDPTSPISPSCASPIGHRLFANPVASSPRSEGPSESEVTASIPRGIDAFAAYYDFLNTHQIIWLRSTLDVIRRNIPISLWASQLEKAGVPLALIDSVMVLMAATREV